MYFLYLLYSQNKKKFYVGTTGNLEKRFYSHNHADNLATKSGIPWRFVYYEAYPTKEDALKREDSLKKYGQALRRLKERVTLVDLR